MRSANFEQWSLFDHVQFLVENWAVIFLVAITAGGGACGLASRGAPEVDGLVRVGTVHSYGFVEPPADIAARVSTRAFLEDLVDQNPNRFQGGVDELSLQISAPKTASLLEIAASAPTVEGAKELVRATAERLLKDHRPRTEALRTIATTRLAELDRQIASLEILLASDPTQLKDSQLLRRDLVLEHLTQLQREKLDFTLRNSLEVSTPTELISAPTIRTKKTARTGIFGFLAGVAAAIFLTYFRETLRRSRTAANPLTAPAVLAGDETPVKTDVRRVG